jgi:trigger factor
LPEVQLPNYKEIAKSVKANEIAVSEEEMQDALKYLQKSRAKFTAKNEAAEKKDFVGLTYQNKGINGGKEVQDQFILGEGGFVKGFEDNIVGMKAGEEKKFEVPEKGEFLVKMESVQKIELPEIGDDFAKTLGAFDTLAALKDSIKEGITVEKTEVEKQRKRGEILEKIASQSKMEIPETMVDYEAERLMEDLKNRITNDAKMKFEDYLASVKKTEKEIKDTYKAEADKRIRNFLVLKEVGRQENVEISDQEVDEEATKAIKNLSKKQLEKVDIEQLREYTKGVLYNEKVFKILECQ